MTNDAMLMTQASATPGFQLIMTRLQDVADKMQTEYDTVDFATDPGRAMHIQVTRDVIQNGIPRIMEQIMNSDQPEPRWTFKGWLRHVLGER
jgi:hypothetical protein